MANWWLITGMIWACSSQEQSYRNTPKASNKSQTRFQGNGIRTYGLGHSSEPALLSATGGSEISSAKDVHFVFKAFCRFFFKNIVPWPSGRFATSLQLHSIMCFSYKTLLLQHLWLHNYNWSKTKRRKWRSSVLNSVVLSDKLMKVSGKP